MSSEDLKQARDALRKTLIESGKEDDYIDDFLSHYDRNLKNIEDWHRANEEMRRFTSLREGRLLPGENIALRADEHGKPIFHVSIEALRRLLNNA